MPNDDEILDEVIEIAIAKKNAKTAFHCARYSHLTL